MADDKDRSRGRDEAEGINAGWAALGYLLAGMAVWGFAGWLVDRWLNTDGLATGIGVVIGTAAGCYLTIKRLGA